VYDSLIESSELAAAIIGGLALLYLVAGLASPSLAFASGRGALFIGVIAYTHMQPDGPHSMDSYLKDYNPQPAQASEQPEAAPAPGQP
jgi:hypothetical protein